MSVLITSTAWTVQARELIPVVYAPGMGVPSSFSEKFKPVYALFKKHGYQFYVSRAPQGKTIEERSEILMNEITRLVGRTKKFHIVAHSMGGLDARRAIQRYDLGERVISVTTIATPHHGTPLADYLVKRGEDRDGFMSDLLKAAIKDIGDAGKDMTTWNMKVFNDRVQNDPRVGYYSLGYWIPEQEDSLLGTNTWKIIADAGSPLNDGMVGADSSEWGTYLGSFEGKHLAQTLPVKYKGEYIYEDTFMKVINNLSMRSH